MKSQVKSIVTAVLIVAMLFSMCAVVPAAINISSIPNHIVLSPGSSRTFDIGFPAKAESESQGVINLSGSTLESVGDTITIESLEDGVADVTISAFGIKLKDISVTVTAKRLVYPGGHSIGVLLYTDGALVVGASNIATENGKNVNPAKECGLKSGDVIVEINGQHINDAEHLSKIINDCHGDSINLKVQRGDALENLTITPAKDSEDGKYKLGVWVRDSTAGVGTLTFYDPTTESFAGLGHAITDVDTGSLLSVKNGEVIVADIIEVSKGESGDPGELKGSFNTSEAKIGKISKNNEFGLYGTAYRQIENPLYPNGIYTASRSEVKKGPAKILTTVNNGGIKEYACNIVSVSKQNITEPKNFIVEITDKELLAVTGGIVQGMSGSPIIQDGKLVGAVTHVLVNDPTRGYGIFIENMLDAAG